MIFQIIACRKIRCVSFVLPCPFVSSFVFLCVSIDTFKRSATTGLPVVRVIWPGVVSRWAPSECCFQWGSISSVLLQGGTHTHTASCSSAPDSNSVTDRNDDGNSVLGSAGELMSKVIEGKPVLTIASRRMSFRNYTVGHRQLVYTHDAVPHSQALWSACTAPS